MNQIPLLYYCVALLAVLSWPLFYRPLYPRIFGIIMALVFHGTMILILVTLELYLPSWARHIIRGLALILVIGIILDALILSITSITFTESLRIFAMGGDFILTMIEAGFSPVLLALVPLGFIAVGALGALAAGFSPAVAVPFTAGTVFTGVTAVLVLFIAGEQIISHRNPSYMTRRQFPLYLKVFTRNRHTRTVARTEKSYKGMESIPSVESIGNRKNVIIVLLESFRSDSVTEHTAPQMKEFERQSLFFPNAYGDGIYTALTWNMLLMNRPGWSVDRDVRNYSEDEPGSPYFAFFKKAGYETSIVSAANINWLRFLDRVQGKEKLVDRVYCPYMENSEMPRNRLDTLAVTRAGEWIDEMSQKGSFFMLLEFDSTHWTYFPDDDLCLDEPSVDSINMLKLRNEDEITPVYNRYRNAVRTVDKRIGKLLDHLKKNDLLESTAVVVVSDHGEGFAPGRIGHSVMHDDIEKVYLSMWLPGEDGKSIEKTVQQRDIFPTLFSWLEFPSMETIFLGSDILKPEYREYPVLIFHGSIRMADLIYRDHIIKFLSRVTDDRVILTPFGITDRDGVYLDTKMIEIYAHQWEDDVSSLIREE